MADYPDVFNAAFVSQYGDGKNLGSAQQMNLRLELAKKMVSGQHSHLTDELEKKAVARHNKELDHWKLSLTNISEAEDVAWYVVSFFTSMGIDSLQPGSTVPAIHCSTPYIHSSVGLAYTQIATFLLSSVTLGRMSRTTIFSLRKFDASSGFGPALMRMKVFIGGRKTAARPRVGRNGIQRVLAPVSPVHSSSMLQSPVCPLRFFRPRRLG